MTTDINTKLRKIFKVPHQGNVVTIPVLKSLGISNNLRKYYFESGWLESLGRGAYKTPGDNGWNGALNALQKQAGIDVHLGGLSALKQHGYSHYFRLSKEKLYLFSPQKKRLSEMVYQFLLGC